MSRQLKNNIVGIFAIFIVADLLALFGAMAWGYSLSSATVALWLWVLAGFILLMSVALAMTYERKWAILSIAVALAVAVAGCMVRLLG